MTIIQCKEHQLWSANPIKAMKAFYDCQTHQVCSEKNIFENDFIDDRHWATNLNDIREAFYEYSGQVKKSKSVFLPFKKCMQKSLDRDLEKIIERLKKRVKTFTSDTQLDQLLDSISNGSCYTNNMQPLIECDNTIDESLLNNQCNIINGLVNCLKMYMDDDEIFKLLDVDSPDQDKATNYLEYIYSSLKKMFGFISFGSYQKTVQDKPIDSCTCSQTDSNSIGDCPVNKCDKRPICESKTDSSPKGDCPVNKCENQPICKSQTDYNSEDVPTINKCENRPIDPIQTDVNNSGDNLTVNKPKIQSIFETQNGDVNCCEEIIKLKNELAKMEIINDQLLREKKMKEIAGCQLLLGIHKARLNIKRENALGYYL
ncbi:uncharacterized protein LOC114121451 isoform X2 [Aphis gossypii]|uniref:uncharacterized protein LOC114121451 isoform X2 n=1 Tax=Aphis gossypii TaxID=80765 RepID=UPI002158CE9E|nr:uncharacterized protein LOC114121451 isoform X2 [Aphis gossypii]